MKMPAHPTNTARTIASAVLNRLDQKRNYAGPILDKLLHQTREKQRATDLVFGTIRNRAAIDTVIAKFADCPVKRIPAKLLNIIRIASYELVYSPLTPEYSIVNEAVETAKTLGGKKQTGFVNALLRQITRHITNRQILLSQANPKSTLPQTPQSGCEFDTNFLPDHETSPAKYLSICFSLPKWLIDDWLNEFGKEQTTQICFASNRRPSIYIRPNTLRTTTQKLAEKLRRADVDCEIIDATMIKLQSPKAVTELPGFNEGEFTIQDISAAEPVSLLNPLPEWTILDLCAAPGTKTTQLAELTQDSAKIIATDIDAERLKSVKENITRLSIHSVRIVAYEQLFENSKFSILNPKFAIDSFNCVLLDVPCSNTGVLAKRIEARHRIKPKTIKQLTKIQGELLKTAAAMIKPQGKICYSTCSIQKDENSQLVRNFLQKNPDFVLESELLTSPAVNDIDHDGGYVAVITEK